jgi:hypothetical protein
MFCEIAIYCSFICIGSRSRVIMKNILYVDVVDLHCVRTPTRPCEVASPQDPWQRLGSRWIIARPFLPGRIHIEWPSQIQPPSAKSCKVGFLLPTPAFWRRIRILAGLPQAHSGRMRTLRERRIGGRRRVAHDGVNVFCDWHLSDCVFPNGVHATPRNPRGKASICMRRMFHFVGRIIIKEDINDSVYPCLVEITCFLVIGLSLERNF